MPCHYPRRRSPAITWKDPSFKGTELSFFVYLHVWVGSNLWNSNYMQKMMNDSLWWDYNWFTGISLASVMRAHYSKALLHLNIVVEKGWISLSNMSVSMVNIFSVHLELILYMHVFKYFLLREFLCHVCV
jgi:hypothetical protein